MSTAKHASRSSAGWFGGRWFGRGRTRALLSLGVVLAAGSVGTWAYYTDTASVVTSAITGGKMDLQVGQTTGGTFGAVDTGTGYSATHITVSALTPAEAYAFPLAVQNVGNADFTYTATVTQGVTPAWTFVAGVITVQVYAGSPVTTDTTYPIQQSCGGSALTAAAVTITAGNNSVFTSARTLTKGSTDTQLCVLVSMISTADNTNQGKTGQLKFDLTATQVTS